MKDGITEAKGGTVDQHITNLNKWTYMDPLREDVGKLGDLTRDIFKKIAYKKVKKI